MELAEHIDEMALFSGDGDSAVFLAFKAEATEFDGWFYAVQLLELIAGATNITLLSLNMRDGLKLKGWLRATPR